MFDEYTRSSKWRISYRVFAGTKIGSPPLTAGNTDGLRLVLQIHRQRSTSNPTSGTNLTLTGLQDGLVQAQMRHRNQLTQVDTSEAFLHMV